ncbi:nucleotide pyrophosphohydrolase [Thermanaerosceptrum fracticalcis]|uniref:Nucleotide pyrophosphohydrolase n=1 Tax=Thermanaerosceptrum fracticalcis TaxID=1712410 RepID=A0A7G6E1A2_THEFR|nr:hypothetical protein [Thermanaerosceptrum fracticalcis]QNB45856.1 nucleotide pyrophosphohydrolase [Thermanaerosceptrum fracticalcis]
MTINELVKQAHENAKKKGFWDERREIGTLLALIHSEVSEALEADRKGRWGNFAEEMADIVIRVCDLCGGLGIDLEWEIIQKMNKNALRERLHGKRY